MQTSLSWRGTMFFQKKRIYNQIVEFIEWRRRSFQVSGMEDYERLTEFVAKTNIADVFDATCDEVVKYRDQLAGDYSQFSLQSRLRLVRGFLRYHKLKGNRGLSRSIYMLK